mmetsp:Transcript_17211/g.55850  ORF Transcript_17211/g.55850 Transcript_17211/m.55850 type:complete len:259 (-) Transcript_17211:518-1294(-)
MDLTGVCDRATVAAEISNNARQTRRSGRCYQRDCRHLLCGRRGGGEEVAGEPAGDWFADAGAGFPSWSVGGVGELDLDDGDVRAGVEDSDLRRVEAGAGPHEGAPFARDDVRPRFDDECPFLGKGWTSWYHVLLSSRVVVVVFFVEEEASAVVFEEGDEVVGCLEEVAVGRGPREGRDVEPCFLEWFVGPFGPRGELFRGEAVVAAGGAGEDGDVEAFDGGHVVTFQEAEVALEQRPDVALDVVALEVWVLSVAPFEV